MSQEQARSESFEAECLGELKQVFKDFMVPDEMLAAAGREFIDLRLEGAYPDTTIVVEYRLVRSDSVEQLRLPIWTTKGFRHDDGEIQSVRMIVNEVFTMAMEPDHFAE
jgi:hypothetical protein